MPGLEQPSAGASGDRARSSQSEAARLHMDVEQPVQQRRAAGDVFGAPGVVTRIMAYCATLEDVSRLSRTCRGAARAPWPPVAPWIRAASAIAEPRRRRRRRRDGPAFGRRTTAASSRRSGPAPLRWHPRCRERAASSYPGTDWRRSARPGGSGNSSSQQLSRTQKYLRSERLSLRGAPVRL